MKIHSLFDPVTGLFSGETIGGSQRVIEMNLPEGMAAIDGVYDHLSQRVDLKSIFDETGAGVIPGTGTLASDQDVTPLGRVAFSNRASLFSKETAQVIDYIPPSPGDDYEWISDDARGNRVRRWLKKPEVIQRELAESRAMAKIIEIETESQPRAVREALIALAGKDNASVSRLIEIDNEIAIQRADLGSRREQ